MARAEAGRAAGPLGPLLETLGRLESPEGLDAVVPCVFRVSHIFLYIYIYI
jgi:hypothetical protein